MKSFPKEEEAFNVSFAMLKRLLPVENSGGVIEK